MSTQSLLPTALVFACGFAAGAFIMHTLASKKGKKDKTPVNDRAAWKSIFQTRLMATWAAVITLDETAEANKLLTMGKRYFGDERWAIGHHEYKHPEL